MFNKPNIDLKSYLPYITNVKAMAGIGMIFFSLYTGCSDIPPKWKTYFDSIAHKNELIDNKRSLSVEEDKLNRISKELDKIETRMVLVPQGSSPDLVLIKVAQKVVDLSESTQNTYVGLQPGANSSLNVDSVVTLPISIPGTSGAESAPAADPNTAASSTPAAAGTPSAGAISANEYSLTLLGTYASLTKFIEELCKISEFIIINHIDLKPGETPGIDEISMKLDFSIPWKIGVPPADQGVSVKLDAEGEASGEVPPEGGENEKPSDESDKAQGSPKPEEKSGKSPKPPAPKGKVAAAKPKAG